MQQKPEDPMTAMAEMAVSLHEIFLAYVAAGFTQSQALYLVGQMVREATAQQHKGGADDA
jgi:hypothetical protein